MPETIETPLGARVAEDMRLGGLRNGGPDHRLRILVLARTYPNPMLPLLGIWTQRLVECASAFADIKVVSPVPYCPPLPSVGRLEYYGRFRRVPRVRWDGAVEVLHPRMLVGPRYSTHNAQAAAYGTAIAQLVRKLRRGFRFDLIHAHFTYPDAVVASSIRHAYGTPVVVTEHAPWLPGMQRRALVRRQAVWAARACDTIMPVSRYVRQTIAAVAGEDAVGLPVPVPVDELVFRPEAGGARRRDQILFAGTIRHSKGADVLIEALVRLRRRRPGARLIMAGEPLYQAQQKEAEAISSLARRLGVADAVEMVGAKAPSELAALMAESAVLAVPGRAETFSSVAVEALACGTPVVATRCGGPEDIVTSETGCLVPPEDPAALADALADVLEEPARYDSAALRRYAVGRFGTSTISRQLAVNYQAALTGRGSPRPAG